MYNSWFILRLDYVSNKSYKALVSINHLLIVSSKCWSKHIVRISFFGQQLACKDVSSVKNVWDKIPYRAQLVKSFNGCGNLWLSLLCLSSEK